MTGPQFSKFTQEDLKQHKMLDELISKNISWSGSTAEMINVYRCLVWFAQLQPKIKDSIAEVVSVSNPQEEKKEAAKRAKAKDK